MIDDPLEPNRRAIKVKLPKTLHDPTQIDSRKLYEESIMLNPTQKIETKVLGRETLVPTMWAAGKIDSTPYCFTSKKTSVPLNKDGKLSNIYFDHYDYPKTKESIDKERPRGKKILAPKTTIQFG